MESRLCQYSILLYLYWTLSCPTIYHFEVFCWITMCMLPSHIALYRLVNKISPWYSNIYIYNKWFLAAKLFTLWVWCVQLIILWSLFIENCTSLQLLHLFLHKHVMVSREASAHSYYSLHYQSCHHLTWNGFIIHLLHFIIDNLVNPSFLWCILVWLLKWRSLSFKSFSANKILIVFIFLWPMCYVSKYWVINTKMHVNFVYWG